MTQRQQCEQIESEVLAFSKRCVRMLSGEAGRKKTVECGKDFFFVVLDELEIAKEFLWARYSISLKIEEDAYTKITAYYSFSENSKQELIFIFV